MYMDFPDFLNFLLMLIASSAPIYVAYRVRRRSRRLFWLAVLLTAFTLVHGVFHLLEFAGFSYIAEVLFWPLGAVLLLSFGILYWRSGV